MKTAIIGLGQSGSAIAEDLYPLLSGVDLYCVNSSRMNDSFLKNIPRATNTYCFGLRSGFAGEFEQAYNYLEVNCSQGNQLMDWVQEIISKHNETLLITHSLSGTGVGTLFYVMNRLKEKEKDFFVKGIIIQENHQIRSRLPIIKKETFKEWSYINKYEIAGNVFYINRESEDGLVGIKIQGELKAGRLPILDIIHNKRYFEDDFMQKMHREYIDSMMTSYFDVYDNFLGI